MEKILPAERKGKRKRKRKGEGRGEQAGGREGQERRGRKRTKRKKKKEKERKTPVVHWEVRAREEKPPSLLLMNPTTALPGPTGQN